MFGNKHRQKEIKTESVGYNRESYPLKKKKSNTQLQEIKKVKQNREAEFEDLMEDLDRYN
jgi:hypothetical protein